MANIRSFQWIISFNLYIGHIHTNNGIFHHRRFKYLSHICFAPIFIYEFWLRQILIRLYSCAFRCFFSISQSIFHNSVVNSMHSVQKWYYFINPTFSSVLWNIHSCDIFYIHIMFRLFLLMYYECLFKLFTFISCYFPNKMHTQFGMILFALWNKQYASATHIATIYSLIIIAIISCA